MSSNAKEEGDDPKVIREKLKTIISQDRNLRTRDRVPKLSAMILDMLPAPRVITSWTSTGRPYKIARLAYTAPVTDLLQYLKAEDLPPTKVEKISATAETLGKIGSCAEKVKGKMYASLLPWFAYKDLPDAERDSIKGSLPPFTCRFKRPGGKKARKSGFFESKKRDTTQVEMHKAVYTSLKNLGVSSGAALKALSESAFDFELIKQEDAILDVYWPSSQVHFPKTAFNPQGKAYKLDSQGAWCPAHCQAVTFTGINSVDAAFVAKMLNKALDHRARVVDLWQYDVMLLPEPDPGPTPIKMQQYKALVLLLEQHKAEGWPYYARRPALDIKEALSALPGYFEIVPGRHARLNYPERAGHCSRCFTQGCHSAICEDRDICGCSECGGFHSSESCDSDNMDYNSEDDE